MLKCKARWRRDVADVYLPLRRHSSRGETDPLRAVIARQLFSFNSSIIEKYCAMTMLDENRQRGKSCLRGMLLDNQLCRPM